MTSVDLTITVTVTASNSVGDSTPFTFTILAFDCQLEVQTLTTTPDANLLMYIGTSSTISLTEDDWSTKYALCDPHTSEFLYTGFVDITTSSATWPSWVTNLIQTSSSPHSL